MRLLHAQHLTLCEFPGATAPPYAILSHTWGKKEISFQEIKARKAPENTVAYAKLLGTCQRALKDGHDWVWIDTCNIDKTSSAELQEAINSMYSWYRNAAVCYVYMTDVPTQRDGWGRAFKRSRWWMRGWTLQELIAPRQVEFYAADWTPIGTKLHRCYEISALTGIDSDTLHGTYTENITAATKMSWAADRETTRPEDMAYCLLGLFDVTMPLLYGEGSERAFLRLQEEFLKRKEDHTLFLWRRRSPNLLRKLLSSSPIYFQGVDVVLIDGPWLLESYRYDRVSLAGNMSDYQARYKSTDAKGSLGNPISLTSQGFKLNLWLLPISNLNSEFSIEPPKDGSTHVALLNALVKKYPIGLCLRQHDNIDNIFFLQSSDVCAFTSCRLEKFKEFAQYKEIYISEKEQQPVSRIASRRVKVEPFILEAEPSPYKAVACFGSDGMVLRHAVQLDKHGRLMVNLDDKPKAMHVILRGYHQNDRGGDIGIRIEFVSHETKETSGLKYSLRAAIGERSWLPSDYLSFWENTSSKIYGPADGDLLKTEYGERIYVHIKPLGNVYESSETSTSRGWYERIRLTVQNVDGKWEADRNLKAHQVLSSWTQRAHWEGITKI